MVVVGDLAITVEVNVIAIGVMVIVADIVVSVSAMVLDVRICKRHCARSRGFSSINSLVFRLI